MCVPLWEQDRCAHHDCANPIGVPRTVRHRRCKALPRGTKPAYCPHFNAAGGECIRLSPVGYCGTACAAADLRELFDSARALREEAVTLRRKQRKQAKRAEKLVDRSAVLERVTRRVLRMTEGRVGGGDEDSEGSGDTEETGDDADDDGDDGEGDDEFESMDLDEEGDVEASAKSGRGRRGRT
ncbi:Uu.00g108770.m01.CDS01 [Anthostomella pinea]|uniref:Uu.00g108770.m01.CDS01 n=1 Tax=Anthostomella pinea TaxID=933095 RepID=A0AAI8VEM0_9PEZI|nr:Uu.00g108770.m01.CDS01 [Anthostomella pinea]